MEKNNVVHTTYTELNKALDEPCTYFEALKIRLDLIKYIYKNGRLKYTFEL